MPSPTIRPARVQDAAAIARVHVLAWQETYRGLIADAVLDDPGAPARRQREWHAALAEPDGDKRLAVATIADEVVGFAMSGPPADDADHGYERQLFGLYLRASAHGSGAGAGLLDAVVDPGASCVLLVADPNPRAQAFYRRHGFVVIGDAEPRADGAPLLRMARGRG